MAVDKLVDSTQLDADLTSVANAIRTKGGTSASLAFPAGFVDAIDAIETGGGASSPFVKLYESTLTEDVQAVKIDITEERAGYDYYILHCTGKFPSGDWWYWNLNSTAKTSGQYASKGTSFRGMMIAAKTSSGDYVWGGSNAAAEYPVALKAANQYVSSISYFYVQGYNHKMNSGTRITLWGANYADI